MPRATVFMLLYPDGSVRQSTSADLAAVAFRTGACAAVGAVPMELLIPPGTPAAEGLNPADLASTAAQLFRGEVPSASVAAKPVVSVEELKRERDEAEQRNRNERSLRLRAEARAGELQSQLDVAAALERELRGEIASLNAEIERLSSPPSPPPA